MHQYGVREVEKLLGLPRSTIRALIDAGFVSPQRGPRNSWLFSFQDLIVLRTAQALVDAKLPARRITKSVREMRRHLPEAMPLSGLRISAEGDRVVVREGGARWQADSGQYLLAFEGDPANGSLSAIPAQEAPREPRSGTRNEPDASDWLERAEALEEVDPNAAIAVYEQALASDAARLDAYVNLGRLLHQQHRNTKAERVYRKALKACGDDPLLWYNLGVLLEDMERRAEALGAYEAALRADPSMADAHYNLALLCEQLGRPTQAIRHMAQYRRLGGAKTD
jgi:tetratricopeptide (TPR) repeat protein